MRLRTIAFTAFAGALALTSQSAAAAPTFYWCYVFEGGSGNRLFMTQVFRGDTDSYATYTQNYWRAVQSKFGVREYSAMGCRPPVENLNFDGIANSWQQWTNANRSAGKQIVAFNY